MSDHAKALCQYFTEAWFAEAIIDRYFGDLGAGDLVVEPSCGDGRFLGAIPPHVPAIGVEIDGVLAELARRATGRMVITGDFRSVPLNATPTAIIGNPPFRTSVIDAFLDRAYTLLPNGGRLGFILPAYCFQSSVRVCDYQKRWSITQEMIPRDIYKRLKLPLVFAQFFKDKRRTLVGFAFYAEVSSVRGMSEEYRDAARTGMRGKSAWRVVFEAALQALGGEADLDEIYGVVQARRPSPNPFWKEKIRQVAQKYGIRVARGRYALPRQGELVLAA